MNWKSLPLKAKSLLASLLLVSLFFSGCSEGRTLECYAKKLAIQSKPGKSIREFAGNAVMLSPDKYLFHFHNKLERHWNCQMERKNEDVIQNAEDMLLNDRLSGDCEDYAVVLMAGCRLKGIEAQLCLGKNLFKKEQGHVWLEVPICNVEDFRGELKARISRELSSSTTVIKRDNIYFLGFISSDSLENYELEYIVDIKGTLKSVK